MREFFLCLPTCCQREHLTARGLAQGLDVTLLEAGPQPGGLVAGWKTPAGRSVEVGIHGTKLILSPVLFDRKTGPWYVF